MELSTQILSDITVHMKYAKYMPELQRRETWDELVERNMQMHIKKYPQIEDEIRENYKLVFNKKVLPSMRSMQFAGKPIEVSPNRVYNCAFAPVDDWRVFSEIMFLLLGGTGVGYSVQRHHIEQLPEIRKPNMERARRWLVGDSIEGWADAVKVLVKSYFFGGSRIRFDFTDVRPKGARLITSGGRAPGPQPLKECLVKIEGILDSKNNGDKLRAIEVHDIVCHIADAVLAGGIRRAALISLFSADDDEMIASKTGNWWEINPQRGRANNSAVVLRHRITKEFFMDLWKRVELSGAGEPGIVFSNDKDWGTNPCVTGDTLVRVKDFSFGNDEDGAEYDIPMSHLVELYKSTQLPPRILSMNTDTGELGWEMLDAAELTREEADVIELELEDGTTIKMTPDHKVYTKGRGYVEAKDLTEDDVLIKII
jgi:ribonucleoside-triphosphate reductase (thioredoxin)